MRYMSEETYQKKMKKIQLKNENTEKLLNLKQEKNKYKQKSLPSTSKLILLAVMALCLQIVLFVEHVTIILCDTSALYALVGIPVALIPIIWGYYSKSKAENTVGGIVYDTAMIQMQAQNIVDTTTDEQTTNATLG